MRPPLLQAGGTAELSMSCGGKSHTTLEFAHLGDVELWVDGSAYQQMPGLNVWAERTVVHPSGVHTYVWKVSATTAGRPDFKLDDVKCSP